MLSAWICQIFERMDGRAVPAQFGPDSKNVQNILNGNVKSSRSEFSDFAVSYLNSLPPPFNDVNAETMGVVVAELASIAEKSGPLSSFFRSQKMAGRDCPETTKLAEAIDALSETLTLAKTRDAIPVFKAALLGAELLDEDYWRCPSTRRDMRLERQCRVCVEFMRLRRKYSDGCRSAHDQPTVSAGSMMIAFKGVFGVTEPF